MEKWNFKIFADFDGTISQKDVGEEIFRKFADEEKVNPVISDLLGDKITSRDCWNLLIGSANPVDKKLLDEFIIGQEIENSFPRFVEYCEENEFELFILSDGFDYYIKKILDRKKEFGKLKVYANTWQITDTGRIIPEFPFYDDTFKSSANCKRNHIISNSSDDYIFAKSDLLKYCEKERITYFPFNNFDDVITKLEELKKKKRLKKRHQAVLNRRKAYMVE
jgi:2-hydroxy-3-keto-5-methylthiopentenyl-1-phosphate phosphatase